MGMSETMKAIADPVRRDILGMLKKEKKSAGEIAEQFKLTRSHGFVSLIATEKSGFDSRK